jgi:hypothetical protein
MTDSVDEYTKFKQKCDLRDLVSKLLEMVESCLYKYQFDYYKSNILNKYNELVEKHVNELFHILGRNITSYEYGFLYAGNVVEFYSWLIECIYKIDYTENRLILKKWIKNYELKRDEVVLESVFFLQKQEDIKKLVKWDTNKTNLDHHLLNLRCVNGDIACMKLAIAREMCSVHTTQVNEYIKKCIKTLRTVKMNNHLQICKEIRKQIISIKIDHENDFREFVETFNIKTIVEKSKGLTVLHTINDLLGKYDLLSLNEREEATMMLDKVNTGLNKVDTYLIIDFD